MKTIALPLLLASTALAAALPPNNVKLDNALVVGNLTGDLAAFYGIPFAKPPFVVVSPPFVTHH